MTYSPLGQRIRTAREQRGWSRAELARSADIPYTTLRNIEMRPGGVRTSEENLKKIADALELSFDQLRILAGYLLTPSLDDNDRERRMLVQIEANPRLHRALKSMLKRSDAREIDMAATYLEWIEDQRHRGAD